MGIYKYKCSHEETEILIEGIRKCKECGMIIITDKGV